MTAVKVMIFDDNNEVAEEGDAVQVEGLWWSYTTTTQITNWGSARIAAIAKDRPGNSTELEWQN